MRRTKQNEIRNRITIYNEMRKRLNLGGSILYLSPDGETLLDGLLQSEFQPKDPRPHQTPGLLGYWLGVPVVQAAVHLAGPGWTFHYPSPVSDETAEL